MEKGAQALIWLIVLSAWAILTVRQYRASGCGTFESFRDGLDPNGYPIEARTSLESEFDNSRILSFIQISDLHLSKFKDHENLGLANFQHFLDNELPAVNPHFVVVTGDLTDALTEKGRYSQQFEEEWALYKGMLEEKGLFGRKDYWFDLRGNHDCFNVDSSKPAQNFFGQYSVQKESSYVKHIRMPFGTYSIVAIDGCPMYGPARPFNFFGSMSTQRMDQLEAHLKEAQENNASHTFLIGHYPTVTMQFQKTSSGKSFADLTKQISAYFSGHLHELHMGLGKTIKSLQPTGFADLEVVDLKEHQTYRVAIVDNDIVSFSDHKLGESPIIHISNPKDARYLIPNHEPVDLITKSKHLRLFVFSPDSVASASILIDDKHRFEAEQSTEAPNLWTAAWNPSLFADNKEHTIVVEARDSTGKEQVRKERFVIPPRSVPFDSFGEWLLNHNFPMLLKWSFALLHLSTLAYLLVVYFYAQFGQVDIVMHRLHKRFSELRQHPRTFSNCVGRLYTGILYETLAFGNEPALILPNVALLLYMTVGPWFVGHLVYESETPAAVYLFGIKHGTSWNVMLDTWFYSFVHMVFFIVPSILVLKMYSSERNIFIDPKWMERPTYKELLTAKLEEPGAKEEFEAASFRPKYTRKTFGYPKFTESSPDEDFSDDISSVSSEDSEDEKAKRWRAWKRTVLEKPPYRLPTQDKKQFKYLLIVWWMGMLVKTITHDLKYGKMAVFLSPCYLWHFIWFTGAFLYYQERALISHIKDALGHSRRNSQD